MLSFKKHKFFKKVIVASSTLLTFIPTFSNSKKIEKQNYFLVQIENDKSPLAQKPILYQFDEDAINYFPNRIPLKYEKINWDLPLHVLVSSLDSFDGVKYFKDHLLTLSTKFDCLPYDSRNHTFIAVINLINNLESSLNHKILKTNYQIEYYKENKKKLLEIIDDFATGNSFDELDVNKMSLSKIKELIMRKFSVSAKELDSFTYEDLAKICQSNSEAIKEIDEVIEFCEAYKNNCESKLEFLSGIKKELINSLYKFVDMWKKNNSWYKNYDSTKEMMKEMKKDYENNKKNNFNNPSRDNIYLFSLIFSILEENDPMISFSLSNFLW